MVNLRSGGTPDLTKDYVTTRRRRSPQTPEAHQEGLDAGLPTPATNRRVIAPEAFEPDETIEEESNESNIEYEDPINDNKMSDNAGGSGSRDDVSEETRMRLEIVRLQYEVQQMKASREDNFAERPAVLRIRLYKKMTSMTAKSKGSDRAFIKRLIAIRTEYIRLGYKVEDFMFFDCLLTGVSKGWASFIKNRMDQVEKDNAQLLEDDFMTLCRDILLRLSTMDESNADMSKSPANNTQDSRSDKKDKRGKDKDKEKEKNFKSDKKGKKRPSNLNNVNRDKNKDDADAGTASVHNIVEQVFCISDKAYMSGQKPTRDTWILDSGVGAHATPHKDLVVARPQKYIVKLEMADGMVVPAAVIGDTKIAVEGADMLLSGIRYVPKLEVNLMSMGKLVRQGFTFKQLAYGSNHAVLFMSPDRTFSFTAKLNENDIYEVEKPPTFKDLIRFALSNGKFEPVNAVVDDNPSDAILALPNNDIKVVELTMAQWHQKLEHLNPADISRMAADPHLGMRIIDHEFKGQDLKAYCQSRGIAYETTTPDTPQSNSPAECVNRIVAEKTRSLLFDSGLAKELWGELAIKDCINIVSGTQSIVALRSHEMLYFDEGLDKGETAPMNMVKQSSELSEELDVLDAADGWQHCLLQCLAKVKSDVLKMIVNGELEDAVDPAYLLDNETELVENDELEDSVNENDPVLSTLTDRPTTVAEAKRSPDWDYWYEAMRREGETIRFRARWVVRGFLQQQGVHYTKSYAAVVSGPTSRSLFAISAAKGWKAKAIDYVSAFLNGILPQHEIVYMQLPTGIKHSRGGLVGLLRQSLYGMKQAARVWYFLVTEHLTTLGFKISPYDGGFLYHPTRKIYLTLHVDDCRVTGPQEQQLNWVLAEIAKRFETKDVEENKPYLEMEVRRQANSDLAVTQNRYINEILEDFGMDKVNPASTSMVTGIRLEFSPDEDSGLDDDFTATRYHQGLGSLQYLVSSSRPDLAFAVNYLSRFNSRPHKECWAALKHVLHYVKKTKDHGILYKKEMVEGLNPVVYSDSDWAGADPQYKSTTGYIIMLNGAPISW
ncbi:predicted protein [Histoplasma mississippiense (nom. inval.)]|uniref:predicted protein n=1 Tax=Ajellomyces capsulatus (strain NAm1 / WU24) TaxID=2059318 RepID=UPI000157D62D|nr:predicted protein [Histoplasma mississippiense (nom. inval.)]EDN05370.1 predicted protein [Histoplasma mississippiense (nom. inval.)]